MKYKEVSVIIPVRNEKKYLKDCIVSLLKQDYEKENMEVIFVDGMSEDGTTEILEEYVSRYSGFIQILMNPKKIVPVAMNLGIKASSGNYIIRLDAHSHYPEDYISKCVYYLEHTEADNVGGLAPANGKSYIGKAFSMVLSSKFGVGNSDFRTDAQSGYVDTVPFGAFRRETFDKYGYYDERLVRNQDYELNYRIRKQGGKIYLANDICLSYQCRETLSGIIKQNFENGKWNVLTYFLSPGSMSIRHFIPLLFVLSLIIMPILSFIPVFCYLFIAEILLYLALDFGVTIYLAVNNGMKYIPILLILFPTFHICYGAGSFVALFQLISLKGRKRNELV